MNKIELLPSSLTTLFKVEQKTSKVIAVNLSCNFIRKLLIVIASWS